MGEEMHMRALQRPKLDAMRAQTRSAPASLRENCQELHSICMHGHYNENTAVVRTNRSIIGISKHSNLRPKLTALRAIRDASSRPYDWQEISMKKPSELPKADALRGSCMSSRGPLYALSCNSESINQTPHTPRIPSKLDALRQQMASAPAARTGPGNLHSFCYDYLYKREGSHRPPKLDEKALRTIDRKLDVADCSKPGYYGHGLYSTSCATRSYPDTSCSCDQVIRSRTHRRQCTSFNGDTGQTGTCSHFRDIVREDFHPKNYRLRSDMDALRRKQQSAPGSMMCMETCNCASKEGDKGHKYWKKSVNFKELKEDLISRYETQSPGNCNGYHRQSRKSDQCTRKCEPSCNCDEIAAYKLRKSTAANQAEKGSCEDLLSLSEELDASQVKCERLDKSLQRQKMMLRLIRRNKERKCSEINLETPPRPFCK